MDRRLDGFDCRFNWLTGIVVGTWITTMRVRASAALSEAQDAESKGHDDTGNLRGPASLRGLLPQRLRRFAQDDNEALQVFGVDALQTIVLGFLWTGVRACVVLVLAFVLHG
jgi:hypothetical protein